VVHAAARAAAALLLAIPSVASAGGPGSTTLLTRPSGLGALTAPAVNDSAGTTLGIGAAFQPT
jgi:hypothetical protein